MRAVQFDMSDLSFPASLVELPEPDLPNEAWARVEVTTGGICGSDLHLFSHNTGPSPTLYSLGGHAFVFGHEIAGRIIEAGSDCPLPVGTRVAVDPCIPCAARGIDPLCATCARGWTSSCLNLDSRIVSSGAHSGSPSTSAAGGATRCWHMRRCCTRSPMRSPTAVRACTNPSRLPLTACYVPRHMTVTRYSWSGPASSASPPSPRSRASFHLSGNGSCSSQTPGGCRDPACGADHAVLSDAENGHFEELAQIMGVRQVGMGTETMLMGGFPYVVEAVGAPRSVTEALRAVPTAGRCCSWAPPG